MKKFILGLTAGAVLFAPAGALAYKAATPTTNPIYKIETRDENGEYVPISVFDDGDNKCYVLQSYGSDEGDISCVKQ